MWDNRRYIIQGAFILIGVVFLVKLFALQVLNDNYATKAERNIVQRIVEYPFRGLIYDRDKELLVYNEPVYDLMVIPKDVRISDTVAFCNLLGIDRETFITNIKASRKYSRIKPSVFLKKVSQQEYARIQDRLYDYDGFFVNPRTVRGYTVPILASEVGYTGEISQRQLDRDTSGYYKSGDNKGITGLEEFYEKKLRGQRGVSYKKVNSRGIDKGSFKEGAYDTTSVPGINLVTTIKKDLQAYAEKLLEGKVGSVVAIEPSTGEVLVLATSPSYDPNLLSGRQFGENYQKLANDSTKPLYNRAYMGTYPAGSIFKTVQALIALDEGVIGVNEQIYVDLSKIGDHAPAGYYDVSKGIQMSSNNYFYEVMRRIVNQNVDQNRFTDTRIGFEKWNAAVRKFGFGQPLGLDLPGEQGGNVPTAEYYDKVYKKSWVYRTIYSLSIGQGELTVTPLQVANLAAIVANEGYYIKPHLVKAFEENGVTTELEFEKIYTGKGGEYYPAIVDGMAKAIGSTAAKAVINDIEIVGKTGTAENGVKDETLDHSVFMAYAPKENPEIAIAVYIENAGWGGRAAAMTASLVIEKYLRGYIKKNWYNREEFVLAGDFLDEKQKRDIEKKKLEKERLKNAQMN